MQAQTLGCKLRPSRCR